MVEKLLNLFGTIVQHTIKFSETISLTYALKQTMNKIQNNLHIEFN